MLAPMAKDLVHTVLRQIRDETKKTNVRLDKLVHRQAEAELRLATQLVGVARAVRELRDVVLEARNGH
jgi:hypothetical protein